MRRMLNGLGWLAPALLAGCSSSSHAVKAGGSLSPADFAPGPGAPVITARPGGVPVTEAPVEHSSQPAGTTTGPMAASEGIADVSVVPGPPEAAKGPAPEAVGAPVLVDVKVGDVNGRPIYASAFLEPMADRLAARAAEYAKQGTVVVKKRPNRPNTQDSPPLPWRVAWVAETKLDIDERLGNFIEDELLRAEAMASFNPEQKQGFFAYMRSVSDRIKSENMGSESAANQRLQSEGGLEQYLKSREEKELVNFQLVQKLNRRINISWREIKLEYDRRLAAWQQTRRIRVRRIELRADNQAAIDKVNQGLAQGRPFAEVAAEPFNLNHADVGGLELLDLTNGVYYGNPELNGPAATIEEGQTVGPIAVGKYVDWIHRDEDPDTIGPLYKEQARIENYLRARRFNEVYAGYIGRLKAKTTMTSEKEMSDRLLDIAIDRYLPKKTN